MGEGFIGDEGGENEKEEEIQMNSKERDQVLSSRSPGGRVNTA
jgi:hypothetical protein